MYKKTFTLEEISSWHEAYKKRLIERGLDEDFALQTLIACTESFDYNDDPSDAADEELSCWSE